MDKLSLELIGETDVIVKRRFAASPDAVFRAHTESKLMQQWMLGPPGWSMPVCISEPHAGGKIRCEWSDGKGGGFYLTGEYLEVAAPGRIVHVERMFLPDPTPDNRIETTFEPHEGGTLLTARMSLPNEESRKAMLDTGMADGMEASYARIDPLVAGT